MVFFNILFYFFINESFGFFSGEVFIIQEIDRIKIDWHWIKFTVVTSRHGMDVIIEFSEFGNIIPNLFAFSMKDVGTILMNFDTSFRVSVGIGITGKMWSTVDNEDLLSGSSKSLSNSSTEESGTNNQIIVIHIILFFLKQFEVSVSNDFRVTFFNNFSLINKDGAVTELANIFHGMGNKNDGLVFIK